MRSQLAASQPAATHGSDAELQTCVDIGPVHQLAHPALHGAHRAAHAQPDRAIGQSRIHQGEDFALLGVEVHFFDIAGVAGDQVR